jgi:phage shock protein C
MTKKLTKSANNKVFSGVLGGFAEYFNIDATLLRIGYVIVSFFSAAFPGILVYIIAAVIMPDAPARSYDSNTDTRRDVTNDTDEF